MPEVMDRSEIGVMQGLPAKTSASYLSAVIRVWCSNYLLGTSLICIAVDSLQSYYSYTLTYQVMQPSFVGPYLAYSTAACDVPLWSMPMSLVATFLVSISSCHRGNFRLETQLRVGISVWPSK